MDIVISLLVGLVAGALASPLVRGGGSGRLGNIVSGIVGAVLGGRTFHALGWQPPFGVAGAIVVALVGAIIALAGLRLLREAARP